MGQERDVMDHYIPAVLSSGASTSGWRWGGRQPPLRVSKVTGVVVQGVSHSTWGEETWLAEAWRSLCFVSSFDSSNNQQRSVSFAPMLRGTNTGWTGILLITVNNTSADVPLHPGRSAAERTKPKTFLGQTGKFQFSKVQPSACSPSENCQQHFNGTFRPDNTLTDRHILSI